MPFVPCPPPFDFLCFEPQLITKLKEQCTDKELIFISHLSPDGDSYNLINQPSLNLDIPSVYLLPINQVEPLDNHAPDDFHFFELW